MIELDLREVSLVIKGLKVAVLSGLVLLMTGCFTNMALPPLGNPNQLVCHHSEEGLDANLVFQYDDSQTQIMNAIMDMQVEFPELLTDGLDELVGFNVSGLADYMTSEDICEAYGITTGDCSGSYKDNVLKINVKLEGDEIGSQLETVTSDMTREEVITAAEAEGFTCE